MCLYWVQEIEYNVNPYVTIVIYHEYSEDSIKHTSVDIKGKKRDIVIRLVLSFLIQNGWTKSCDYRGKIFNSVLLTRWSFDE